MFEFSTFKNETARKNYGFNMPISKDFRVYVCKKEVPVYTCRISKYPINTWWPNHQRPIDQTEEVSYVNLVSDQEITVEVEPLTKRAFNRVMIKPYSKGVKSEIIDGKIIFTLTKNGGYVLELDDYHGCLYLFNNKPEEKDGKDATYRFDAGVHFVGKIVLKDNESVFVHKDALVYGCIYAKDAKNIKVYGNGIFDDGNEERVNNNCYDFTNGNLKFINCDGVSVSGVGFMNSAIWCVNIFNCKNVHIGGVNVFGQWRYNTDGIDIVNSQNVTVENCFVHSFDDSIVVKGLDYYATTDVKNITVNNCVLWCDWGRALEIGAETHCKKYSDVLFNNCDVIRAGFIACDIQNGDCAEIHDVTFKDIRIELENFYTAGHYQNSAQEKYDKHGELAVTAVAVIENPRFRELYLKGQNGHQPLPYVVPQTDRRFASVHDVIFKDITVYLDQKILERIDVKNAIFVSINNKIERAEFNNIKIENLSVNGKRLTEKDFSVYLNGSVKNFTVE